jgi:DoxX-like family
MRKRDHRAVTLAALQTADLVWTRLSPRYGDEHLAHLGVPVPLRQALPLIKTASVGALLVTAKRPVLRSIVSGALVSYYSAAVTFHVLARDSPDATVPAAACAALACSLL